jgi:hypothetical protein
MHRSGTSLLSNCLIENGFSIGKTKNQDKDWQNPKGYFENDRFGAFHNRLLRDNNSRWDIITKNNMHYTNEDVVEYRNLINEEFTNSELCLIKDPRLSFFTKFIKEVCSDLYEYYFVFCTRDKEECCTSLSKAQKISYTNAEILYDKTHINYINDFLKVDHNDTIYKNQEVLDSISKFCDLDFNNDTTNLVDLDLYRNRKNE